MAQLKVLQEKGKVELKASKLRLVRMLYERNYDRQHIVELFRFIDWLMWLPKEQALEFKQELTQYEEEKMPYITSIQRMGRKEGAEVVVVRMLKQKFGKELTPELEQQISSLSFEQLEELGDKLLGLASVAELQAWLAEQPSSE